MTKDTLYLEDFELTLQLEVEATWHRGSRGARDGRGGPPLEPDEPAGYEIEAVYATWRTDRHNKTVRVDITSCLSDADIERIQEQIDEDAESDPDEPEYDSQRQWELDREAGDDRDADEPDWSGARP